MPSNDKIVECPADDCDYTGLPISVSCHYQAMTDGMHPGGKDRAMRMLSSADASSASPADASSASPADASSASPADASSASPADASSSNAQASSASSETNPTMGSADPSRAPQRQQQASQQASQQRDSAREMQAADDEPVCLRCGGELYDFQQFEAGRYHAVNGAKVYVRGDYQCSACAKWWMDEEEEAL